MSEHNPFAVGDYAGNSNSNAADDPSLHPQFRELIQLLIQTRPWVRLIAILLFIGSALMGIGGLFMMAGGALGGGAGRGGFMAGLGFVYVLFSAFYVYPGICLIRYASSITDAETTGQMSRVVEAILHQKKFWRFCGIVAVLIIVVYALIAVLALTRAL